MITHRPEKGKTSRVLIVLASMAGLAIYGYVAFSLGKLSEAPSGGPRTTSILVYGAGEPGISDYKKTELIGLGVSSKSIDLNGAGGMGSNTISPQDLEDQKAFLGSVNGTKYYPRGCGASSRIKPENTIWFPTADEAEEAGYTQSTSCSY